VGGLITVALLICSIIGKELFARWQARNDLEQTIAELDQSDPRWRLEDVEADRVKISEDKNSARIVVAAHRLLPKGWKPAVDDEWGHVPPAVALRQDQADRLSAELKPLQAALEKARTMKEYPLGRQKIQYSADWFGTRMEDQQKARHVGIILQMDVVILIHRREMEKAWNSNRALLNSARSLGDEPILISNLIRIAMDRVAIRNAERMLGQGELTRPQLEEQQKTLEEEAQVPLILFGMRGERAGIHHLLTKFESGEFPLLQTLRMLAGEKNERTSWWDPVSEFFAYSMVWRSHVTLLRLETNAIEAMKLPVTERYKAVEEVDIEFKEMAARRDESQTLARFLFPAVFKVAQVEQRIHTHLACAAAGLAAERFRLQTRRWPESLEELVKAGLLEKVPIDLFDGESLRFRHTQDGLVIFSVGRGGKYDGKALDDKPKDVIDLDRPDASETRIEFRLWDIGRRRQTPPKEKDGDEEP
jgi:hypothetical protein